MQNISIYGAGGAGCNIVLNYVDIPADDPSKPLYPKSILNILDTSDSNMKAARTKVNSYLVPGLEGAGKHRTKAFEGVSSQIIQILNDHKPSPMNLVIFSASGGSGSVIGPLVTAELLRRNLSVVCIVIGSTTSAVETDNTHKTLRTLQSMAANGNTGGRPLIMYYLENGSTKTDYTGSRVANDLRIEEVIRQLALLFSGNHRELDRTDLVNWLNWKATSPDIPAQLAEVLVFKDNGVATVDAFKGAVIGTASILGDDDDPVPDLDQPYSCVGYINPATKEYAEIPNHHYIITGVRLPQIFRGLEERMVAYKAAKMELMKADLVGISSEGDSGTGMIL